MPGATVGGGGSFATRPLRLPTLPSAVWTAIVAVAGALLTGHVSASAVLGVAVVAGLGHGAGDFSLARRTLQPLGPGWWVPFLLGYPGLVALTLAMWALAPVAALSLFLLLSTVHFGIQDAADYQTRRSWPAIIALGGAPIIVPAVFHLREVERLFSILVGAQGAAVGSAISGPVAVFWALAAASFVVEACSAKRGLPKLIDLGLVGALFAAATPLVAFAFYFALLHAPRALAVQRGRDRAVPRAEVISLTAIACVIGLGIFVSGRDLSVADDIVRSSFLLLSALTVPHMALDYLAHVSGRRETGSPKRLNLGAFNICVAGRSFSQDL